MDEKNRPKVMTSKRLMKTRRVLFEEEEMFINNDLYTLDINFKIGKKEMFKICLQAG